MNGLSYDTLLARREGLTRDLPKGDKEDLRWVTNSSTLIFGEQDAVLVDTFVTIEQNEKLIEWVKDHDRRLVYIYLTHGHADHIYGIGQLLRAFPGARAVATDGTLADARVRSFDEPRVDFWRRLFPGQIPQPVSPELLESHEIDLEGRRLQIVETGHTDTQGSTALWAPDIGLLVSGDVVYNNTHMFLGETTRESRIEWIATLGTIKLLEPAHVIAGHKDPARDDDPGNIDESVQYLTDFNDAEFKSATAIDLYETVLNLYPRRVNPGSLWGAAKLVKGAP